MLRKSDKLHILFASRLVEEKWVDILIQCIEKSLHDIVWKNRLIWHITSDGYFSQHIQKIASESGGKIIFHGRIQRWQLASLYRSCDILFMPSRFLETFGLTALESLACGTPVVWFAKGWLVPFIHPDLALDPSDPVDSFFGILREHTKQYFPLIEVSSYREKQWISKLDRWSSSSQKIAILHDYKEKIGGAEYYIDSLEKALESLWKDVYRFSCASHMSVLRRRLVFIFSLFTVWRYFSVRAFLIRSKPDIIWMHSVMRYIGFWWLYALRQYTAWHSEVRVYISHHDIGLMTPFPQWVTEEMEIPVSFLLRDFIAHTPSFSKKVVAVGKWCYIWLYRKIFPALMTHIIFSPFIEKHVRHHFGEDVAVLLLAHSYDEHLFFPDVSA